MNVRREENLNVLRDKDLNHISERSDDVSIDQNDCVDKSSVKEHRCDGGFEELKDGIKLAVKFMPVEFHCKLDKNLLDDAGESARLNELDHDMLIRVDVCDEIDVEVDVVIDIDIKVDVEIEIAQIDRRKVDEEISRFENWAEKRRILLAEGCSELLDVKNVVQA